MSDLTPLVNRILSNNQVISNPIVQNAMQMCKNNDINGLQTLANNIAKERGTTVDDIRKQLNI